MNATPQAAGSVPGHNDPFQQLKAVATTLGEQSGVAKDARVKLFVAIVDAAYQGVIDQNANKHGPERDDATVIMETYAKAQGSKTIFDTKAPNVRKEVSCGRACIKLGSWTKGGPGQPVGRLNDLLTIQQKLRKDPTRVGKLDDAANIVLRYARSQVRSDALLEDDVLTELCYRKVPDLKTATDYLKQHRDALQKLYDGKAVNGTAHMPDPLIEKAIKELDKCLKATIAQQRANAAVTPSATHTNAQGVTLPGPAPVAVSTAAAAFGVK